MALLTRRDHHWLAISQPAGEGFDDTLCSDVDCVVGALLVPTAGDAQIACTREGLQWAVDLYVAAEQTGDVSGTPPATGLGYIENMAAADMSKGLNETAMTIDHHRSLVDPATCRTFAEVIVTNKDKPSALATRLRVNGIRSPRSRSSRRPRVTAVQRRRLPEVVRGEEWDPIRRPAR